MPATYAIDPARGLVRITQSGRVTVEDSAMVVAALAVDPCWDPALHFLIDMTPVETVAITFADMHAHTARLARGPLRRGPQARSAVVAPGDVCFGTARMFQSLSADGDDDRVGVFRTLDEALAFLGVGDAALRQRA